MMVANKSHGDNHWLTVIKLSDQILHADCLVRFVEGASPAKEAVEGPFLARVQYAMETSASHSLCGGHLSIFSDLTSRSTPRDRRRALHHRARRRRGVMVSRIFGGAPVPLSWIDKCRRSNIGSQSILRHFPEVLCWSPGSPRRRRDRRTGAWLPGQWRWLKARSIERRLTSAH